MAAEGADQAIIEFGRFRLDPEHAPVRLAFACLLRKEEIALAIGNYVLLVEQDRDSLEGYRELGKLALTAQDLETARSSVARASALAPRPGHALLESDPQLSQGAGGGARYGPGRDR